MVSQGKIKKHTIGEAEPLPFQFLGIVSAEPDYRLSVMLNHELGINLSHSDSLIPSGSESSEEPFSRFVTAPPAFSLITNRNGKAVLIKKLGRIDFLLVIGGEKGSEFAGDLVARVRKVPGVTSVFLFSSHDFTDRNIDLLAG